MELHEWTPLRSAVKHLPWKPIKIMPIGDIQYSGPNGGGDLDLLRRYINWGLDNDCYWIGMGDYIDFVSPSNRSKLRSSQLYDSALDVIDQAAAKLNDDLLDVLSPTKGRWLGMLQGHHYHEFQNGITSDEILCQALNTTFLGDCCMVRLTFRDSNKHRIACTIWAHHGAGSASTPGAAMNKLDVISRGFDADIFLMAHVHQVGVHAHNIVGMSNHEKPRLVDRTVTKVLTGSFMRGYMEGNTVGGRSQGSYVEKKILRPNTLGAVVITIAPVFGYRSNYVGTSVSMEPVITGKVRNGH